jgi:hypothetical protein
MPPLQKFWPAIESVPGAATVFGEWRERLGPEIEAVMSLLVPTDRFATTLRLPQDPHIEYRVIRHGPDDLVGVRADDGSTIKLLKGDVLIYRLNHQRVVRESAGALGFTAEAQRVVDVPFTFRAGAFRPLAGFSIPVFATFPLEPIDLQRALESVCTQSDGPFVFLAPTGRYLRSSSEAMLSKRSACFFALNEAIENGESGTWCATDSAKRQLTDFQDRVIPRTSSNTGMVFFPTPTRAKWSDLRIKFVDGHTISVVVCGEKGTFVYSQMGMADGRNGKPKKQWDLLRSFAQGLGTLTWKSRSASRDNQKRKETLVQDLKAFFRLDGDPIVYSDELKGWQTVFQIEPDS